MHGSIGGEKSTVIPLKKYSDYFLENMAVVGNNWQQLQITSACDARCSFCSNDQNSFETARAKFRDVKEIEQVLFAMPPHNDTIYLNESLPGRISEGEALIHPKLLEIMAMIRRGRNNIVSMTTSGSRFTPELIEKLAAFKPIEVTMSVPSVTEEYWTEIFKLKTRHFENAMNSIPLLQKHGFFVKANMTPMPAHVGYDDIEKTIAFLARNGITYLFIYAPGYTKYTDAESVERMKYDKHEMSRFIREMSKKYRIEIQWPLDPNGPIDLVHSTVQNIARSLYKGGVEESYWFTSTAAYDRIKALVTNITELIPGKRHFVEVKNRAYGGNIESAGLWMVSDIRDTIEELGIQHQHCIIPIPFLDKYGFDLNGENINDYLKKQNNIIHFLR